MFSYPSLKSTQQYYKSYENHPPEVNYANFSRLIQTAFQHRRKMIRKSLNTLIPVSNFTIAEISPQSRPEELSVADWVKLANTLRWRNNGKLFNKIRDSCTRKTNPVISDKGVRRSGLHELQAEMVTIDLQDTLRLRRRRHRSHVSRRIPDHPLIKR